MRVLFDRYFKDSNFDEQNRTLFAFASYNAGPNRIAKIRTEAKDHGLDPNKWFNNVEIVAAKRIGQEPCTTSGIFINTILPTSAARRALMVYLTTDGIRR
jgi:membrane-bound lytic murein transglycosylase MltF